MGDGHEKDYDGFIDIMHDGDNVNKAGQCRSSK